MFWPDVIDLKLFYASRLGGVARRVIARKIDDIWPDAPGEVVLGIGYTHPYLEPFLEESERVLALMPASQGALHWPHFREGNLTLLADESEIPLPEESVSRVLLVHSFENTEQLRHMLRDIWRVLAPGGRILVVAPNRRGVWARRPVSPFAHGSPFTGSQMRAVLRDNRFTPYDSTYTLFTPPSNKDYVLRASRFFETIGPRFFRPLGGVVITEAEKQIYAPSKQKAAKRVREQGYVPAAKPAMTFDV